jgi:hypothetical protein
LSLDAPRICGQLVQPGHKRIAARDFTGLFGFRQGFANVPPMAKYGTYGQVKPFRNVAKRDSGE